MRITMSCLALVFTMSLVGCGPEKLQYHPDPFIGSAKLLSADYTVLADKLMVECQTDGYRFDQVWIAPAPGSGSDAEGKKVEPTQIEYNYARGGGFGFGVGIGGRGGGVGVGTNTGGSGGITGITKLFFDKAAVGDAPWKLHIKLMGMPRTVIVLEKKGEGND